MTLSRFSASSMLFVCACLAATFVGPRAATAQPAPAANMSMADAAAAMASGDRDRVVAGRLSLISKIPGTDKAALGTYARDVAAALLPITDTNDAHAKLNVAIVVQRLADQSGSVALADIITKLIRDPSPAIAASGIRACWNVLPRAMADPQLGTTNQIVPAILEAVQKNSTNEAVAAETYYQMTRLLLDRTATDIIGAQAVAIATPKTIDAVHALMAVRLREFGTGTVAEPAAEQWANSFLGRQSTWTLASKPQQMNTMRLLLQLMNGATAEMEKIPAGAQMSTSRDRLNSLRALVKGAAQSLGVICDLLQKPDLKVSVAKASELSVGSPIAVYKTAIAAVEGDFAREFPELKDLSLPADGAPATQPTTAP